MKKITIDKFSDYPFKLRGGFRYLFHKNSSFFFPKPLYLVTLTLLFFAAFLNFRIIKLFIPLLVVYIYQTIIAKRMKGNLRIKRDIPEKSKEDQTEVFNYTITNPNPYPLSNCSIFDFNEASSDKEYLSYFQNRISSHQKRTTHLKIKMNNGMGLKSIGPLVVILTDALGLNRLTFVNDSPRKIKVYPAVHPTKSPRMLENLLNLTFGEFDTYKKGNNVNFYSTKEYQQGDNINHVNWKLSLKANNLIVNEFESNANATLYTVLIDDDRLHFGEGKDSSFEYCKDLALSLLYANVRSNNDMGFISHQKHIKATSGKGHLNALELLISSFEPKRFEKHNVYSKNTIAKPPIENFGRKVSFHTDQETNLFVFTGLISGKIWDIYFENFKTLARKSKKLHLIVVYGYKRIYQEADKFNQGWIAKIAAEASKEIQKIKQDCRANGIVCSFVNIDAKFKYPYKIKEGFKDARE